MLRFFGKLLNSIRQSNKARAAKSSPRRISLQLEALEDRLVMSAASLVGSTPPTVVHPASVLPVQLHGTTLIVTGDNLGQPVNDQITLATNSSKGVQVNFNGQLFNFAAGQVTAIEVDPEGGSNTTNVNATPAGVTVDVECENANGTAHDTVNVGNGNLNNLGGNVFVNGASQASIFVDDHAATAARDFTIINNSDNSQTLDLGGSAILDFTSSPNFTITGGTGGNQYNVNGTSSLTNYTINPGQGHNTISLGLGNSNAPLGDLDALQGPVTVSSNGGTDTVVLHDASHAGPLNYTVTASSVTGSDFAGLTYSGIAALDLDGGGSTFSSNNYTLTGNNLAHATSYTINAGGGLGLFDLSSLNLGGLSAPVTLNGGGSYNLQGPNATTTTQWSITGVGSGTLLGTQVSFKGMDNLLGGSGKDEFEFNPGGSIPGAINGQGGADVLDYSRLTSAVAVNVQTGAASDVNGGKTGAFFNIGGGFIGSASAANRLTGPDANTNWTISSANSGSLVTGTTQLTFKGFENLVGGSGVDVFKFGPAGSVAGSVNGGLAPAHQGNWLDYSGRTTAVTVNLLTGAATGVDGGAAGKVTNIQDVHGGNGGNTLTGNAQGNILIGGTGADTITGGTGRSILIGDAGSDSIKGGSGGDILIGDATAFDSMTTVNEQALMSILAEWQSADSYLTRCSDIDTGTGGGLNGTAKLNFGTTVRDDGSADTLTGEASGSALDWFFQGVGDTLHNAKAGEFINNA